MNTLTHLRCNEKSIKFNFVSINATILFFMMIVFPQTYQLQKAPFLAIIGVSVISSILLSGKIRIDGHVALWFYIYIFYGVLWGGLGIINKKEYAIDFLRIYAVWIFIYMFLVIMISSPSHIETAHKIIVWSALAIAIININYFLYGKGAYYISFLTNLDMGQSIMPQNIGIHAGYSQISNLNIGSMFFLIPYIFSDIMINRNNKNTIMSQKFKILVFLLCMLTAFLSGRRMLLIIAVLMTIVYIVACHISRCEKIDLKVIFRIIFGASMIFSTIIYVFYRRLGWDIQQLIERLTFSGEEGVGVSYRISKSIEMITEVCEKNLLFGTGGGSKNFEITFVKTFHETGILGLTLNLSLYISAFLMILMIIKRRKGLKYQGIPLFVGSVCFFAAMWANPFASFDFMWTLFLPVAFINTYLKASKRKSDELEYVIN